MSEPSDWRRFFDAHASKYMQNVFTRNTTQEIEFLYQHLGLRTGMRVLDIGCGTGRHAVELARRSIEVTGIDLSPGMLREAHLAAQRSGVSCRFIEADALTWRPDDLFDAAICLCEGAFGLLGKSDDPIDRDLRLLRNLSEALRPGGRFMITMLSAARLVRSFDKPGAGGSFDLRTQVQTGEMEEHADGAAVRVTTRERMYMPAEIELMCRVAGLKVAHIGGGTAGNWALRPLEADEYELMVLGHK